MHCTIEIHSISSDIHLFSIYKTFQISYTLKCLFHIRRGPLSERDGEKLRWKGAVEASVPTNLKCDYTHTHKHEHKHSVCVCKFVVCGSHQVHRRRHPQRTRQDPWVRRRCKFSVPLVNSIPARDYWPDQNNPTCLGQRWRAAARGGWGSRRSRRCWQSAPQRRRAKQQEAAPQ